jgi:hypothetical protein
MHSILTLFFSWWCGGHVVQSPCTSRTVICPAPAIFRPFWGKKLRVICRKIRYSYATKWYHWQIFSTRIGWELENKEDLTQMRPAAYCKYRFVIKSNYRSVFLEIYMKCISGTLFYVLCRISDEILRYVGAFCKCAPEQIFSRLFFFNVNLSEISGPENGCTFVILMFGVGPSFTSSKFFQYF